MRALVVVLLLAGSAAADPPATAPAVEPATPPAAPQAVRERECWPAYAEPALLVGGSTGPLSVPGHIILRTAFGGRLCIDDVELHAGLVLDLATDASWGPRRDGNFLGYGYAAWGGEARATWPITERLRFGPRISLTSDSGVWVRQELTALWLGVRVEADPAILGLDYVHVFDANTNWPRQADGIYASASFRGLASTIVGGIAILVLGVGIKHAPDHSD